MGLTFLLKSDKMNNCIFWLLDNLQNNLQRIQGNSPVIIRGLASRTTVEVTIISRDNRLEHCKASPSALQGLHEFHTLENSTVGAAGSPLFFIAKMAIFW